MAVIASISLARLFTTASLEWDWGSGLALLHINRLERLQGPGNAQPVELPLLDSTAMQRRL